MIGRTIIEVDGVNHVPYTVDEIQIYAGMPIFIAPPIHTRIYRKCRPAVLFRCKFCSCLNILQRLTHHNSSLPTKPPAITVRHFLPFSRNISTCRLGIRATPSVGTVGFTGGINSAILRYIGAADEEPETATITSVLKMNETELVVRSSPR